ncbi:DUF418 domain-containing protein [Microbacterium sp. K27]|uniref:DUF418 domain-containing protein n=1 Tax=Microbacterium sp. K27 TaxID=2305445 RepID=UPI00144436FF|nr:DUF418 domain-containing protein [Microbacterium sp. K27]
MTETSAPAALPRYRRTAKPPHGDRPLPEQAGDGRAEHESPETTAMASPGRIASLDVIRGVAIIGTLASNVWLFQAFFGERVVDIWWQDLVSTLSEGKFLGLLTIMFGIGLEIQRQAALRRGRRWPGTYLVRAGLLFVDGMLNYIFVVQFDVLRAYAVLGFVVAFVLLLPEKRQWVFIGVALVTHVTLILLPLFTGSVMMFPGLVIPGESPTVGGRPTYWEEVQMNTLTVFSDLTVGTDTGSILTLGLVVFTLGAMLYRHGLFDARGARLRRWVMIVGLGAGIPGEVVFFLMQETFGLNRFLSAPLVAFGILALMASFYRGHRIGLVGRALSLVGQMALSCYVLQNILGRVAQSIIGHSPLAETLDPLVGTLAMFFVIAALVILFANLWMRRFRKGPLEYVWDVSFRFLTRSRVCPIPREMSRNATREARKSAEG